MTKPTPCDPPCSLACLVTEGAHHTAESLRNAALEELARVMPDDTHPTTPKEQA